MTEFQKADADGNGSIDQAEWDKLALEDKRLKMADDDAQKRCTTQDGVVCIIRHVVVSICYNYL